jgi:hypothetical protein
MFTRSRHNDNTSYIVLLSLAKKRVVVSELETNSKLNEEFIKFITGKETIKLRNSYSNDITNFTPRFITLLICNNITEH